MKHRWFVVLACGWVLLQPPPKLPAWTRVKIWVGWEETPVTTPMSYVGDFDPDIHAPLSQWQYRGSFDTAKECMNEYARAADFAGKLAKKAENESSRRQFAYMDFSRCLPASLQLR